ncbi:MAG TPA: flagellar biosynthesis anti-sigma factor FlgM [bacterium]|nr:flagellar biosynthesis anti-sigma factor FlgM [bacterium]
MKIEGNIPSQVVDSYRKVDSRKQAEVNKASDVGMDQDASARISKEMSDNVSISDEAKLRALAQKTLEKLPDVRQEKVDRLSKLIQSGRYNPDAEKIAEKILSGLSIKV